ncbi:MAG: cupin domain-containing protein, partial [Candidatus Wallbacteria bacterium]|nr:cupin domain-containing protein [Candidatus Wallbacteria bacterium]
MARKSTTKHPHVANWNDAPETDYSKGKHWGDRTRRLTPSMASEDGHFGINYVVVKPGKASCPFHWHVKEDEAYIILQGSGLVRYGDDTVDVGAGDCVSFPRNSGQGHQIANVSDQDLVYLAIGENCMD